MSTIDKNTLQKLAHLARLELSQDQESKMTDDLGAIVDWVEKLEEVNTDGVEPLASLNEDESVLRADRASNHFDNLEALANAPQKSGEHFVVPKVLG